jgi:hypothetical protein
MADARRGAWAMEPDARTKARIAALSEEMDAIHSANNLYWKRGPLQALAARVEYQFRGERLESIRAELAQLRSN